MMYACGYVPVSLIHCYEKRKGAKYASFVQCLLHMAVGTYEDTYDYARRWFESINRGSAFEIDNSAYNFFLVVEKNTCSCLESLHHTSREQKSEVLEKLTTNEDILFHWSMSVDLDDEELPELLNIYSHYG